jgi:hypothetical protein
MCPINWTIMFHVLEHIPNQIRDWGPVRESWMFCMESFFGKLTRMIKNTHHPISNIMRTYSVSKAVNVCIALMNHTLQKDRLGIVAPTRLPPCIPPRSRTACLGEKNRSIVLPAALRLELVVFLKQTPEYQELQEMHREARRDSRQDERYVRVYSVPGVHPVSTLCTPGVHPHTPYTHPVYTLCTPYVHHLGDESQKPT